MTGGFDAVPAELRGTAGRIDEVIGAGSMKWVGPGSDFGHSAVEQAWGVFDDDIRQQYDTLIASAAEHGVGLRQAARAYEEVDLGAGAILGRFSGTLDPVTDWDATTAKGAGADA